MFTLWYAHGRTLHCTAALQSLCCVNGSTNKKKKKACSQLAYLYVLCACCFAACPGVLWRLWVNWYRRHSKKSLVSGRPCSVCMLCLLFCSVRLSIYLSVWFVWWFAISLSVLCSVCCWWLRLHMWAPAPQCVCPYATVGTPAYLFASFLILIHERRAVLIF